MLKKRISAGLIGLVTIGLAGCAGENKWPEEMGRIQFQEQIEYEHVKTIGTDLELGNPQSILWADGEIYISDTDHDRIVISDEEGRLLRTLGQTGNGPLEWIKPTGLAMDEDRNLYIVDSGNNRVQILDAQEQYVKEIAIPDFPYISNLNQLLDIAVHDGLIYLTSRSMDPSWAKIFVLSPDDGTVQSYGKNLVGHLVNAEGRLRYASMGQFVRSKEQLSYESGRNYLVELQPERLGDVRELPYKYTPGDIQSDGQSLILLSKANGTIDRFDWEGAYMSTAFRFQLETDEMLGLGAFAVAEDQLYVLNARIPSIYVLRKT